MAPHATCSEELLRNAAKQRIRRMIKDKKKRTDLAVPSMVREQWDKGTEEKNMLAQLLMDSNWCKDPLPELQTVYIILKVTKSLLQ